MAGNNALQFLRGTSTAISNSTEVALAGQPVYDTTNHYLYVGDGSTQIRNLEAVRASVADKIGTKTVGSGTQIMMILNGTPAVSVADVGSSTRPVYLDNGTILQCSRDIPSITLNGSPTSTPSFYAPRSAGTSGYLLISSGSGAPTWKGTNPLYLISVYMSGYTSYYNCYIRVDFFTNKNYGAIGSIATLGRAIRESGFYYNDQSQLNGRTYIPACGWVNAGSTMSRQSNITYIAVDGSSGGLWYTDSNGDYNASSLNWNTFTSKITRIGTLIDN